MKARTLSLTLLLTLSSGNHASNLDTQRYIQSIEQANGIRYETIVNTRASYITPMCYTQTKDSTTGKISNPCYSCHTKGKIPNYTNDSELQLEHNFPEEMMKNPFTNFFKDRSEAVAAISNETIVNYVNRSNYFDKNGSIELHRLLPRDWQGYRPDCYYHFDDLGFDRAPDGGYTGWRAFRYYPFLGTFWPTNGSTDDVLIRLSSLLQQDKNGVFDRDTYRLNLAIVEAVVKQKTILLPASLDEKKYGVDLNQNGTLGTAKEVVFNPREYFTKMSYAGKAREALKRGTLHLAGGLFPEGTEFLHSVRYIGCDAKAQHVTMARRMKELRYARKVSWSNYSTLDRAAQAEMRESEVNQETQTQAEVWQGSYEKGLQTGTGWVYQGFIEARDGSLRPQTHEETISCMGCHAGIGTTTDTVFAFPRKFEGTRPDEKMYGWNHWSQKGLVGIPEPKASYLGVGEKYEYSYYLQNNHSGNEFRDNDEVQKKFFNADGTIKKAMIEQLHHDISPLLFPSKTRAMKLNKSHKVLVDEQGYIYGRDANVKPMNNVCKKIGEGQVTQIKEPIVQQ
ncbi:MAG TPA: hypothetical protein ENK77_02640 [Epsilonproteobacteria bacterium]|nr:hypothetical protein [Campylobacterota bacterium]HHH37495.1 hypothetical protein [Campylobacterota bacterium]